MVERFFIPDRQVRERAVLIGVALPAQSKWHVEEMLDELALLANTAGADVVDRVVQERSRIDPAFFIGQGKAESVAKLVKSYEADLVIFDEDLSPAQVKNLERVIDAKIIDRSGIILDIFARRARTREAKTQVELAQLRYLLPRLTRQWTHLSRQQGGIGMRGPGETQLEVDRRRIRERIAKLSRMLKKIDVGRKVRRVGRRDFFRVAIVGYTNSGKSTLLNALTRAEVFTEDQLFATLDATTRLARLEDGGKVLLTDTVGFLRKLPHHLVASFKGTLEEAIEADVLLHVVDVSHPNFEDHMVAVREVLDELNILEKPSLLVFNKIDCLNETALLGRLKEEYPGSVAISALKGDGLDTLRITMHSYAQRFGVKAIQGSMKESN
ncbi:MAG: GTPase HflX [Gemmatimonadota bacterium]|nr:MAG: GTPase HflX [Gemmatimonadota bacterium]